MIKGIGVDIVDMEEITPLNMKLVDKILTENEYHFFTEIQNDKRRREFFGGRFAAKEAFAKAMGTGIGIIAFKDCEVLPGEGGKPVFTFLSDPSLQIHLSISHSKQSIIAMVVLEKNEK